MRTRNKEYEDSVQCVEPRVLLELLPSWTPNRVLDQDLLRSLVSPTPSTNQGWTRTVRRKSSASELKTPSSTTNSRVRTATATSLCSWTSSSLNGSYTKSGQYWREEHSPLSSYLASEREEQSNPKRPHVHRVRVSLAPPNLRREVRRSPHSGPRAVTYEAELRLVLRLAMRPRLLLPPRLLGPRASELAGETEVADDGPALVVKDDVLGLDVAVDDPVLVQLLKREDLVWVSRSVYRRWEKRYVRGVRPWGGPPSQGSCPEPQSCRTCHHQGSSPGPTHHASESAHRNAQND